MGSDLNVVLAVNGSPDTDLTASAEWVEVVERLGRPTTFRIHFGTDVLEQDFPLLADERLEAGSKLSVLATVNDQTHCLVMGPVRGHKVHFQHGGSGSYLEVEGGDTTLAMDRESKAAVWPDQTDSDAVTSILSQYGYTPDVETTTASHAETKHALVQRETDWRFVQRLARRNGFLFWVTADETGIETAHFKQPPVSGEAELTLTINLAPPAFQSLDLEWDAELPTSTEMKQLDLNTKQPIDGSVPQSSLPLLGETPLSSVASETRLLHLAVPADDAGDLSARSEAALREAGWFIRAAGETSVLECQGVVRAHTVVELQGLGTRHSGKYFVSGVTHTISKSGHKLALEFLRNAWGAGG